MGRQADPDQPGFLPTHDPRRLTSQSAEEIATYLMKMSPPRRGHLRRSGAASSLVALGLLVLATGCDDDDLPPDQPEPSAAPYAMPAASFCDDLLGSLGAAEGPIESYQDGDTDDSTTTCRFASSELPETQVQLAVRVSDPDQTARQYALRAKERNRVCAVDFEESHVSEVPDDWWSEGFRVEGQQDVGGPAQIQLCDVVAGGNAFAETQLSGGAKATDAEPAQETMRALSTAVLQALPAQLASD
jgi:hypothetical protein